MLRAMERLIASAGTAMPSVYPSGGDLATSSLPRIDPAPGRVSTITGWPSRSESGGAIVRASVSAALPGPLGATIRTGFTGYCGLRAAAQPAAARHAALAAITREIQTHNLIEKTPSSRRPRHAVVESFAAAYAK